MGKKKAIHELTNLLAKALRHKIGSIVNPDEVYAQKYARDADVLMKEAHKAAGMENWNSYDKAIIQQELKRKLHAELTEKKFLDNRKFDIMEDEMNKALEAMELKLK